MYPTQIITQPPCTQQHFSFAGTVDEELCEATQVLGTEEEQGCAGAAGALADNHATTPDLGSLLEGALSLAKPLFNIFLPRSEQRVRLAVAAH